MQKEELHSEVIELILAHFHPWGPAAFFVQHSGVWVSPEITVLKVPGIASRAALGKHGDPSLLPHLLKE